MPDSEREPLAAMDRAYALGDHHIARAFARALLASPEGEVKGRAERVLSACEPDHFIELMALLGVGVLAGLGYAYFL